MPAGGLPKASLLVTKNPLDSQGRLVYVDDYTDICFIELPTKLVEHPDHQPIDCPESMDDPAWDDCGYGLLMAHKTKPECYCVSKAGADPPVHVALCPAP